MLSRSDRFTLTELCEQFGISRKTAYKHLARYEAGGLKGLHLRSHRPHSSPQRTDAEVEALILTERRRHHTWGPKKIQVVLETKHGLTTPPACGRKTGQTIMSLVEALPFPAILVVTQPDPFSRGGAERAENGVWLSLRKLRASA